MVVKVCVGSSCHLKGSYQVIEQMKVLLKKYDVEDLIDLQASFCLGHCAEGVNVQTDSALLLHHVTEQNAESLFVNQILPLLNLPQ